MPIPHQARRKILAAVEAAIKAVGKCVWWLRPDRCTEKPLFPGQERETELSQTMDVINRRYGRTTVYLAGMHSVRDRHAARIAFGHVPDLSQPNG